MKLILANNQTDRFKDFYKQIQEKSAEPFDYTAYSSLLFVFDTNGSPTVSVINLDSGRNLQEYSGVYINNYTSTYELAATVAVCCNSLGIGYYNHELSSPPSLSKLSMYAKLAGNNVSIPKSFGGTKSAILRAKDKLTLSYPAVLKQADADRGVNNYKINSFDEINDLLNNQSERSLWILQEYIENKGYYLISYYGSKPAFSIYRTLEERPDGNQQKAHMYKPVGGSNATLVKLDDLPKEVTDVSLAAIKAMDRQIAGVDCLYDELRQKAYILEVNYNPQLVTIETFKDVRIKAFLDNLPEIGN